MRKADYETLARIVKKQIDAIALAQNGAQWELARIRARVARDMAHEFAALANVDRAAFLKACGFTE